MTTTETAALKAAAERLADLINEGGDAGLMLPESLIRDLWGMIGMALTDARRPSPDALPMIPMMTATLEGQLVMLRHAIHKHNARKREAGL